MKYTIELSPEFVHDAQSVAASGLHLPPEGDKYKCTVSVDRDDGTTIDVPVRLLPGECGTMKVTFEL